MNNLKTRIIINRHNVRHNQKNSLSNSESRPCISIQTSRGTEYAKEVRLEGVWILKQDFEKSPCSGATIWLEGIRENVSIIEEED